MTRCVFAPVTGVCVWQACLICLATQWKPTGFLRILASIAPEQVCMSTCLSCTQPTTQGRRLYLLKLPLPPRRNRCAMSTSFVCESLTRVLCGHGYSSETAPGTGMHVNILHECGMRPDFGPHLPLLCPPRIPNLNRLFHGNARLALDIGAHERSLFAAAGAQRTVGSQSYFAIHSPLCPFLPFIPKIFICITVLLCLQAANRSKNLQMAINVL